MISTFQIWSHDRYTPSPLPRLFPYMEKRTHINGNLHTSNEYPQNRGLHRYKHVDAAFGLVNTAAILGRGFWHSVLVLVCICTIILSCVRCTINNPKKGQIYDNLTILWMCDCNQTVATVCRIFLWTLKASISMWQVSSQSCFSMWATSDMHAFTSEVPNSRWPPGLMIWLISSHSSLFTETFSLMQLWGCWCKAVSAC